MTPKHMDEDEFVALARKILGDAKSYEDDMIEIQRDKNGLDLEVTRKKMPQYGSHLSVTNPTTMVSKGKIIRHHGEHCYIVPHMEDLAAAIDAETAG